MLLCIKKFTDALCDYLVPLYCGMYSDRDELPRHHQSLSSILYEFCTLTVPCLSILCWKPIKTLPEAKLWIVDRSEVRPPPIMPSFSIVSSNIFHERRYPLLDETTSTETNSHDLLITVVSWRYLWKAPPLTPPLLPPPFTLRRRLEVGIV